MSSAGLDLYDVAFLVGGTDRVVDTVLVALVESPELEPEPRGDRNLRRLCEVLDRDVVDRDPTAAAYSTRNSHVYGVGPGGG